MIIVDMLSLVLLIVAAVLFILAAANVAKDSRVNLIALGLFFVVLAIIFPELERLS